MKNNTNSSF